MFVFIEKIIPELSSNRHQTPFEFIPISFNVKEIAIIVFGYLKNMQLLFCPPI